MPEEKKKFVQLNMQVRCSIKSLLPHCKSLSKLSEEIGYSRQTIYREILRNSLIYTKDKPNVLFSCVHYFECHNSQCKEKKNCHADCKDYERGINCKKLKKYPFVCNNCPKRGHCNLTKRFYDPEAASSKYHNRISETHNEIRVEQERRDMIIAVAQPLLKKKQSPEVIVHNHKEFKICSITLRNWIDKRAIPDISPTDLRLFGRRIKKYDYTKKHDAVKLAEVKLNHCYTDYLAYIALNINTVIVQMDTVMGKKEKGKSVLTIHMVKEHFQFGILLEEHTAELVNKYLKELFTNLKKYDAEHGTKLYAMFVQCIICDNGTEFDKILDLEEDDLIHIFFTRAYKSTDKPHCERNHVLVRYINEKGISWDDLTQDHINLMFSHIDAYARKSLEYETPYQKVLQKFGKEFLDIIGITYVKPDDVNLTQGLIRKLK